MHIQFVAVVILRHFARTLSGKISPVTTHAIGPQVAAKKKMKMQINAIPAFCAATLWTIMVPAASCEVVVVPRKIGRAHV